MTDNEKIARFMGYQILHKKFQVKSYNSSNEYYWANTEGEVLCNSDGNIVEDYEQEPLESFEDLNFKEWNTLMPVVEKVVKSVDYQYYTVFSEDDLKYFLNGDIKAIHAKIVLFIEMRDEYKKSNT